jgi:hypothetical protein
MNQIELSFEARDKGIKRAVDHANLLQENWSDQVYQCFVGFILASQAPFQMEDFRETLQGFVADPPSKRAFGHIVLRAAKEGLITRVGYAPVKNVTAHRCFSSVWKSCK